MSNVNFQAIVAGVALANEENKGKGLKSAQSRTKRASKVTVIKPDDNGAFLFPTSESMQAKANDAALVETALVETAQKPVKPASKPAKPVTKKENKPAKKTAQKPVDVPKDEEKKDEEKPIEPRDFATLYLDALSKRQSRNYNGDTQSAIEDLKDNRAGFNACFNKPEFAEIFDNLVKRTLIANSHENKTDFISHKTLQKVVRTAYCIARNAPRDLDNYVRTIGVNVVCNAGLTIKDTLVSLSQSIEYHELEQRAFLERRLGCKPGTAGAQSPQVRVMVHAMGIATTIKGRRDDVMMVDKDNARFKTFATMFKDMISEEKLTRALEGKKKD